MAPVALIFLVAVAALALSTPAAALRGSSVQVGGVGRAARLLWHPCAASSAATHARQSACPPFPCTHPGDAPHQVHVLSDRPVGITRLETRQLLRQAVIQLILAVKAALGPALLAVYAHTGTSMRSRTACQGWPGVGATPEGVRAR